MSATTTTITTAETVARALDQYPTGITTRELAKAAGLGQTTVQTALTAMEANGTARRTPGTGDGKRRTADLWRPVTTDTTSDASNAPDATPDTTIGDVSGTPDTGASNAPDTTPETTTGDASNAPDTTPETTTGDASNALDATAETTTGEASGTPDTADTDTTTGEAPDTVPVSDVPVAVLAPVSAPPAPVAPRQPDLKVLIMAGVLGNHPDGISAHGAINESGLAVNVADTILLAMEVAGAAYRLPAGEGGAELWMRGDGDLSTVDPANAPTHVTCPTCGHTRPIRRAAAGASRTRTGRPAPEVNSDGSERLRKNDLRNRVEAFLRDLGTGHDVTPGTVARELGRSPGAVGNAMDKLDEAGVLVLTNEAPRMFALSGDAPTPTVAVTTFMRRPIVTTGSEAPAA